MKFDELCLLAEAGDTLTTVARYTPGPSAAYFLKNTIENYISRNISYTDGSMYLYLGKPGTNSKNYLTLIYYNVDATTEAGTVPAKHYRYVVPDNTKNNLRTQKAIFSPSAGTYLNNRLVFFNKNKEIQKTFPKEDLKETLKALYEVDEFFKNQYGNQYAIAGDVYTYTEGSTIDRIKTSVPAALRGLASLPGLIGQSLSNLGK